MRRINIHEKFKVLCQLFASGSERPIAGGRRLAVGGGDVANAAGQHSISCRLGLQWR